MFRPHKTALTIELKLSSSKIIAADYLATSVPAIPMAKPTSAFFKAGASFVPSPVTATTSPLSLSPVTRAYLSSGLDLAKTRSLSLILSNYSAFAIVSTLNYFYVSSASLNVLAQSQTAVRHVLQTTPPTSFMKSDPYITISSASPLSMPTSFAMALAVIMLSPVTILTLIPALWHCSIACGTYGLGIS